MIREDYLIRLIRQLADAIARIAGFRKRGEYVRAHQEVAKAWDTLDVPRELVNATDADTLASLLREPGKLRAAAELLAEEAQLTQAQGDPLNAGALRMRAIELLARARVIEPDAGDDVAIAELGRYLAPADLSTALNGN